MSSSANYQGAAHHPHERPILPDIPQSILSLPLLRIPRQLSNTGTLTNISVSAVTNCHTGVDQKLFPCHTVEIPLSLTECPWPIHHRYRFCINCAGRLRASRRSRNAAHGKHFLRSSKSTTPRSESGCKWQQWFQWRQWLWKLKWQWVWYTSPKSTKMDLF